MSRSWKQISIVMPVETVERIDRDAKEADVDRSQLIAQLIDRFYIDKDLTACYNRQLEEQDAIAKIARDELWRQIEGENDGHREA
jgi:Ribbon-helix-helix protein, copG family